MDVQDLNLVGQSQLDTSMTSLLAGGVVAGELVVVDLTASTPAVADACDHGSVCCCCCPCCCATAVIAPDVKVV